MSISRRELLAGTGAAGIATAVPIKAAQSAPAKPDLFIGTGGHGHTYPGATVPFGMVQLSPDTDVERWDACSGYHRDDSSIMGPFASGANTYSAGCTDLVGGASCTSQHQVLCAPGQEDPLGELQAIYGAG